MKPLQTLDTLLDKYLWTSYKYLTAFTVSSILVLPTLIWIALDKSLWKGDPVGYALNAVSLYQNLTTNLLAWRGSMFNGYKGPLLFWLGQFLVPIGSFIGSINFALLLIPFIASFVSLVLLFKSFEILFKRKAIAICGTIMVAASPLLNSVSTAFWIEPLQLCITCWFIYATLKAKDWSFYFSIAQFVIAGSLATMAKLSTPLYIISPAIVFLVTLLRSYPPKNPDRKDIVLLLIAILFFIPTAVFYLHNIKDMLDFARFAATSPLFAAELSKFDLWVEYMKNGIFLPTTFNLAILLLLLGVLKAIRQRVFASFATVYFLALCQIIIFFFAWIISGNGDSRYFLSLMPYFAILVCWSLSSINLRFITVGTIIFFLIQFVEVSGATFGLMQLNPSYVVIWPLTIKPDKEMQITSLAMPLATRDSSIIFDMDPGFGLASLQYELAKKDLKSNWRNSTMDISAFFNYNHQQIDTSKIDVGTVWQNVLNTKPDYYFTWKSRLDPDRAEIEIRTIDRYNANTVRQRWAIADKMKNCEKYELIYSPSYPELLIYKRCDIPMTKFLKTQLFKAE